MKSTGIAFAVFAECYKRPGKWIMINDHFVGLKANRHLTETMRKMASQLEFHFEWKYEGNSFYVRLPELIGDKKWLSEQLRTQLPKQYE